MQRVSAALPLVSCRLATSLVDGMQAPKQVRLLRDQGNKLFEQDFVSQHKKFTVVRVEDPVMGVSVEVNFKAAKEAAKRLDSALSRQV
jgi:hypothetical protein